MASASFSLSSPLLAPKFAVSATPPLQCVRFRRQHRVSAAYTTAERSTTASRPHSRIATSTSLYEVLGIHMGATCLEVKTAYRRLARVSHPDVASDGRKDASADEFIRIHAAYSTLSDPEKRADYDRTLIWRRSMSGTPSACVLSGYARRSWETDQCW
ncbi:Chaperone protein dnaJ 11 like [Actinidia chinensis var. chinensis]|uniref:Chaperone protein dnaJ 11 like n=1 Tax=Actinidia chinensis var. chinensis TaxID=1590841 RepID=A0A2R6R004_ACTCC|nr:Chaperone protein dnaJ 11 like [Actinidia chinensis var. chinensis]